MSLVLELAPELESRLKVVAAQKGFAPNEFVARLIEQEVEPEVEAELPYLSARELLKLPRSERGPYLRAAAAHAAPLYNTDLALPPAERELTAFTILDGEPVYEYEDEDECDD